VNKNINATMIRVKKLPILNSLKPRLGENTKNEFTKNINHQSTTKNKYLDHDDKFSHNAKNQNK
jgi:hypothetical protein